MDTIYTNPFCFSLVTLLFVALLAYVINSEKATRGAYVCAAFLFVADVILVVVRMGFNPVS